MYIKCIQKWKYFTILLLLKVGYDTAAAVSGFNVMLVDPTTDRRSELTQCQTGISLPSERSLQMRTCFTATIAKLRRDQLLQLEDATIADRDSPRFQDNSTHYFGAILLQTDTGRS